MIPNCLPSTAPWRLSLGATVHHTMPATVYGEKEPEVAHHLVGVGSLTILGNTSRG
jgi:hypothetical protein